MDFILIFNYKILQIVHRCGTGGSMRACHAAGPGSIPIGTGFLGEVFLGGGFLTYKTNVRKF